MGFLSKFEGRMEDTLEGAADKMVGAPLSPVKIAKKAEKQMRREKMVGAGKQFAPTLYTVLVSPEDDDKLFGYYPTLAGETETYLNAKAAEDGLIMDGQPLVRFIVDDGLRHGKFDVIAEMVAAPIVAQLRDEEMERYGISAKQAGYGSSRSYQQPRGNTYQSPHDMQRNAYDDPYSDQRDPFTAAPPEEYAYANDSLDRIPEPSNGKKPPLPYVPENELDRSIDYGEYTFNSQDFEDYQQHGLASRPLDPEADYREPLRNSIPLVADSAAQAASAEAESARPPREPLYDGTPDTVMFAGGKASASDVNKPYIRFAQLRDITNGGTYSLAVPRLVVGRESTSDIAIPDINVSRVHCELRYEEQGSWLVGDLGSRNGTFVNDRKVTSAPLREGDVITIGMTNLMFTLA